MSAQPQTPLLDIADEQRRIASVLKKPVAALLEDDGHVALVSSEPL